MIIKAASVVFLVLVCCPRFRRVRPMSLDFLCRVVLLYRFRRAAPIGRRSRLRVNYAAAQ